MKSLCKISATCNKYHMEHDKKSFPYDTQLILDIKLSVFKCQYHYYNDYYIINVNN